jgi:hypothetical protein
VRRADRAVLPAAAASVLRGDRAVAAEARTNSRRARFAQLALVDGTIGIVVAPRGKLFAALKLTITSERISEIDVIGDRTRLEQVDLAVLVN